jgi:hypothetical protein
LEPRNIKAQVADADPTYNYTKVQKGVSFTGNKIFNNLPKIMLINLNIPLKNFSIWLLFYCLGEYSEWKTRDDLNSYNS